MASTIHEWEDALKNSINRSKDVTDLLKDVKKLKAGSRLPNEIIFEDKSDREKAIKLLREADKYADGIRTQIAKLAHLIK